jgi:hypothetical protein
MDPLSWSHPTGNSPKTVTLVCLGPSVNGYMAAKLSDDLADAVLGVDEVWTLNRGIGIFDHDLGFVMDHIQGEADKYPRYGAMLWNSKKPIITSDNCAGWPAHVVKFPLLEIWDWLIKTVQPMHGNWFHNSLAYILVYAGFIGVQEIRVFGADYSNHANGVVENGHPCVAYWTGKLESQGLLVRANDDSSFLNANQRSWMYGYQDDPRTIRANRSRFNAAVGIEADPESLALRSGERQVGEDLTQIQPDHLHRYEWAASRASGAGYDLGGGIGYGSAILADADDVVMVKMVERSQESIDFAKANYGREKVSYYQADLDNREFPLHQKMEFATAFEIIEHLSNPEPLLKSLNAQRLFASVPNETVIPYSPEYAPFHHRHYTKDEFIIKLKACGWSVVGLFGQLGPDSDVIDWRDDCRTIVVDCLKD